MYNKKLFLLFSFIIVLFCANNVFSQDELDFNSFKKTKRVLLLPFDPRIYYNDASSIMLAKENISHDALMQYFRSKFDLHLYNSIVDSCTLVSLLNDNTKTDSDDISNLYTSIHYELRIADTSSNSSKKKSNFFQRKRQEKHIKRRDEEFSQYNTRIKDGEITGRRQSIEDTYLDIVFYQPEILAEIAKRRDIDYFLFINEFTIKGNYGKDSYISGNQKASRTIKVHYSIFNKQAVLVNGGFASTLIPFTLDTKEDIVNQYFPKLVRQIISKIKF